MGHPDSLCSSILTVRGEVEEFSGDSDAAAWEEGRRMDARRAPTEISFNPRGLCQDGICGRDRDPALSCPSEAHQRNVIALTAADGELLDDFDYLLTQFPGGVGLPLHGGI
jgi:hypothetical protein